MGSPQQKGLAGPDCIRTCVCAPAPAPPPPVCVQKTGQLRHKLVAHSRWLSAMDIHPSRDNIVTAAQDCTVGVWQLPIAGAKVRTSGSSLTG